MILKQKNMKIFAALGLAAGALLIILSVLSSSGGERGGVRNITRIESDDYVRVLEEKITEVLSRAAGISDPFVMITLEASSENRYAVRRNIRESTRGGENTQMDVSKDIIFYGDDNRPVLIKEIKPRIRGVAVVAGGISGADMQLQIINLVSTVLNVPTNRVYVISAD